MMPPGACKVCIYACRIYARPAGLCTRCAGANEWVREQVRLRAKGDGYYPEWLYWLGEPAGIYTRPRSRAPASA